MINEEWCTDYEGRCGNCHEPLMDGDKYCRHCGTKRGKGKFKPYQNLMQCIYGPRPVERTRQCTKCKKIWKTMQMIDNENYCPYCGARSRIIEEDVEKKSEINFWDMFK